MLNKHKLFLLCAKWIPVVTAIGILVTNTIAYYGCNDIVVDIFNFNIGTSVAGVILMYVCSYAFNFCIRCCWCRSWTWYCRYCFMVA